MLSIKRLCKTAIFTKGSQHQRAFSLIEMAIVLAVIALVISGIWVAASSAQRKNNVNNLAIGIKLSLRNFRHHFDLTTYPSSGINYPTSSAHAMGVFPADYTFNGTLGVVKSPEGASLMINQQNNALMYTVYFSGNNGSTLSGDYCKELLIRLGQMFKTEDNFSYAQIFSPNAFLYPPFTAASVTCNNNNSRIQMYFTPSGE